MKNLTEQDVLQAIRKEIETASLRKVAGRAGVDAGNLCRVLNGERPVSDSVARAFGFERVETVTVIYRKKAA
jgi:hypothetical protein